MQNNIKIIMLLLIFSYGGNNALHVKTNKRIDIMTISTETQKEVVNYLNDNINEKRLIRKAAKKFNISYSSVYRIAGRNNVNIFEKTHEKEVKELSKQEQILYDVLKQIARVRKSKFGEIRVQKKDGNYVSVVELFNAA